MNICFLGSLLAVQDHAQPQELVLFQLGRNGDQGSMRPSGFFLERACRGNADDRNVADPLLQFQTMVCSTAVATAPPNNKVDCPAWSSGGVL